MTAEQKDVDQFREYVKECYGIQRNSENPHNSSKLFSEELIDEAIDFYIKILPHLKRQSWGYGDSFDRLRVYAILCSLDTSLI